MSGAPLELRPYQSAAIAELRAAMRRCRRVVFQLPTGGGKTIIFGRIAASVIARGRRALILVHRRELIRQTVDKLALFGVEPGIIAAGLPAAPERPIQVASVQTLAQRLDQTPAADLVIVDECHHAVAGTWAAVLEHYAGAFQVGVTATPERLDGKGLASCYVELVCGPGVAELTAAGYLAEAKVLTVPAPDLTGVKTVAGDYAARALADVMSGGGLIGDAVEHYRDHADGVPAIAFCVTIDHAQVVAERFRAAGYRAASVDGTMPTGERDAIIGGLATGALQIGNALRHGHPAAARLWSLEGRPARERAEAAAAEREQAEREQASLKLTINARLVELGAGQIDAARLARMRLSAALKLCPTEADLRRLGQLRGYQPGFAWAVMQDRRGRRAAA